MSLSEYCCNEDRFLMNRRNLPNVFSTVPFCQEANGSQKYVLYPMSFNSRCRAFSGPLSKVIDLTISWYGFNRYLKPSMAFLSRCTLIANNFLVLRSTRAGRRWLVVLLEPSTSPSKSPNRILSLAVFGRLSMETRFLTGSRFSRFLPLFLWLYLFDGRYLQSCWP